MGTFMDAVHRERLLRSIGIAALATVLFAGAAAAVEVSPYVQTELQQSAGPFFTRVRWSPYFAGAGIGILSWLTFLLSDNALGVSGAYARTAGMAEVRMFGERARLKPYYQENKPVIDWGWMLVLGLLAGSTLSAVTSGDFTIESVPPLWAAAFGGSVLLRFVAALAGGWLIGFGARWAGGVHERARHQRLAPDGARQLARGGLLLHRRHRGSHGPLPSTRLGGGRCLTGYDRTDGCSSPWDSSSGRASVSCCRRVA